MECLENFRTKIDEIDAQLADLFEKRMEISLKIASCKMSNKMHIFDKKRESEVLNKNLARLKNRDFDKELEQFFKTVMELSKQVQSKEFAKNALNEVEM